MNTDLLKNFFSNDYNENELPKEIAKDTYFIDTIQPNILRKDKQVVIVSKTTDEKWIVYLVGPRINISTINGADLPERFDTMAEAIAYYKENKKIT